MVDFRQENGRMATNDSWLNGEAVSWFVGIGCSASLAVGFLDMLLSLAADPMGYPSVFSVFPSLAVTVAGAFATYILFAFLVILFAHRVTPRTLQAAAALGCFVVVLFVLFWIADLSSVSVIKGDTWNVLLRCGILGITATATGLAAWHVVPRVAGRDCSGSLVLFIYGLLSLLLGELAWLLFLFNSSLTSSWGSVAKAFALVIVVGFGLLAVALLHWARRKDVLQYVLLFGMCVVIASPAISYAAWHEGMDKKAGDNPEGAIQHVILITIDTLRRDSLSCYEPNGAETPKINALAEDGVVFSNAYTASPWTIPSMVSIMTGVCSDVHGVNVDGAAIPRQYKTLAEYMNEAGYLTAAIGYHVQLVRMGRGFLNFDIEPKSLPYHGDSAGGKILRRLFNPLRPKRTPSAAEAVTNIAIRWLEDNSKKGFFLWVHYLEPHDPYTPPSEFLDANDLVEAYGTTFSGRRSAVRDGSLIRTESERRWLKTLYDGGVAYTDHQVGRLLDTIKHLDIYDDALIILTSDHGEEFWDHGEWQHGQSLYNELVRAPLIVKLPGGRLREKTVDETVSNVSILPTILDLCEIDYAPESLTVPSLAVLWREEGSKPASAPVFFGSVSDYEPREAVVFDHYKLIRSLDRASVMLFDLNEDPMDQRCLAVARPEVVSAGMRLLDARTTIREELGTHGDSAAENGTLDARLLEKLRSLGYLR